MKAFLSVLNLFPSDMRASLQTVVKNYGHIPEEIRIRVGQPVFLRYCCEEVLCDKAVTREQMLCVVGNAAEGSFHTAVHNMELGFIPLRHGGRMGICGGGIGGKLSSFWDINSVCIRIPSEAYGCADKLCEQLYANGFRNTIIVAPPGLGKTTLLREIIRKLSYGGMYVSVADEREELSGLYQNQATFDLGPRTDVLSGISKTQAAMMMLRAMSPDVIAMDEITAFSDSTAIMEAVGCGVGLLTTIHGEGIHSLRKPVFRQLYDAKIFENAILIDIVHGRRRYRCINLYDEIIGSDIDCCYGSCSGEYASH